MHKDTKNTLIYLIFVLICAVILGFTQDIKTEFNKSKAIIKQSIKQSAKNTIKKTVNFVNDINYD